MAPKETNVVREGKQIRINYASGVRTEFSLPDEAISVYGPIYQEICSLVAQGKKIIRVRYIVTTLGEKGETRRRELICIVVDSGRETPLEKVPFELNPFGEGPYIFRAPDVASELLANV